MPNVIELEKTATIIDEIADYRRVLGDFESGRTTQESFQRRRLWQGIYGQRQLGVQMIRIKLPYGIASTPQWRAMARLAREYTNGILHITTRQAIQLHHIPRGRTGDLLDQLSDAGLTSREACGNTVRAITGDYLAGVGADQAFDFRPVAEALFLHCLRNPYSQNLPRKFKISFSGSDADRGLTNIHDIGFIARVQDGLHGFRVVAGGGLGYQPYPAEVCEEFLPISDVLLATTAFVRLFNAHGNRKQRNKARMKYVKEKWGLEKFRTVYREIFDELKASDYGKSLLLDEASLALALPAARGTKDGLNATGAPADWLAENVEAEVDPETFSVLVRVELGDLESAQVDRLADLADALGSGEIRTTPAQNIVFVGVPRGNLAALHAALAPLGFARTGFGRVSNTVACPGRSTCNLSMTSSKGLAKAITEELAQRPELDAFGSIRISGCPNSCGQHHIGSIGFHGLAKGQNGRSAPFAQLVLAGGAENGIRRMGRRSVRVAAKNAPRAVLDLLALYKAEQAPGQSLDEYLAALPDDRVKAALAKYGEIPDYAQDPSWYRDFDSDEEYSPAMGQGECAGGVIDLINEAFLDAENTIAMSRRLINDGFWSDAIKNAFEAAGHAFRAALSNAGEESASLAADLAVFEKFYGRNEALPEVPDIVRGALPAQPPEALAREIVADVALFVEELASVYRWKPAQFKPEAIVETAEGKDSIPLLDLKGVGCPMNYVKVKLKLETMDVGQQLEVILDAGEPYRNVPASLRIDGQEIVQLDPIDNAERYSMIVKKKA